MYCLFFGLLKVDFKVFVVMLAEDVVRGVKVNVMDEVLVIVKGVVEVSLYEMVDGVDWDVEGYEKPIYDVCVLVLLMIDVFTARLYVVYTIAVDS